jgi:hypothetical protein
MAGKKFFEHSNFGYLSNTYVVKKVGIERIFFSDNENDLNTLFLTKKEHGGIESSCRFLSMPNLDYHIFPQTKRPEREKKLGCVWSVDIGSLL